MEKAEGSQPTAAVVEEAVFEILPLTAGQEAGVALPAPGGSGGRIQKVGAKRQSWSAVEKLLEELEGVR